MGAHRDIPRRYSLFFHDLGRRVRLYRTSRGMSQQAVAAAYGFSLRHYQMIEAGRPINVVTMLRICEAFDLKLEEFVAGLWQGLRLRRSRQR